MEQQLTKGAIAKMLNGDKVDDAVLQVMSHKRVAGEWRQNGELNGSVL